MLAGLQGAPFGAGCHSDEARWNACDMPELGERLRLLLRALSCQPALLMLAGFQEAAQKAFLVHTSALGSGALGYVMHINTKRALLDAVE